MDSPRRSRRLAGLPPVSVEEEYEYVTEHVNEKNGLIYTDSTRGEFVWISLIIVFFIIPLYLFLANS